jgi:hypothetical protein
MQERIGGRAGRTTLACKEFHNDRHGRAPCAACSGAGNGCGQRVRQKRQGCAATQSAQYGTPGYRHGFNIGQAPHTGESTWLDGEKQVISKKTGRFFKRPASRFYTL